MIKPVSLLLHLLPLLSLTLAACPESLPTGCSCKDDTDPKRDPSIFCANVPYSTVLSSLPSGQSIDSLRLSNCSLQSLDSPLPPLKKLRLLELSSCGIERVKSTALSPVSSTLEELNLAGNRLNAVPVLGGLAKLTQLNLNHNLIHTVPEGIFEKLPRLRNLRLESNLICSMSPIALNETKPTLELLDLSGNCFSAVPSLALLNAKRLMFLDLTSNKITDLAPLALMNLPRLLELRLSDNLLSRLHPLCITNTPELKFIDLRNNLIDTVASLTGLKQLELLDVRHNRLTKIPSLLDFPKLRQLRLDSNKISSIEPTVFSAAPDLQLVSIQDNSISTIAPHSFDGLSQLVVLLLANNQIDSIDDELFEPLASLQQLNLRNNSIKAIGGAAFAPLKLLSTLDLGHNYIEKITKGSFEALPKLFWLDLSNNRLRSFEKTTFAKRITNLLIDGNPLTCDDGLDWFVSWLVLNRVRTYLPSQSDPVCVAPQQYEGVKLKDLMMKKANETMRVMGLQQKPASNTSGQALLNNLVPGLSLVNGFASQSSNTAAGLATVPGLGALVNSLPALRSLNLPMGGQSVGAVAGGAAQPRAMNSAIEQFTAPFIRMATGGQAQPADIEQLIQAIPNMIASAPGGPAIDVSLLPPNLLSHIMRGGQVPGIPKDAMDKILRAHMEKMAEMAAAVNKGETPENVDKYLPPLENLPPDMITSVMNGQGLPILSPEQMDSIKQYYIAKLPVAAAPASSLALPHFPLNAQTLELMKLMPTGYNISRIPMEILDAISKGEIPDLKLLPKDLQDHLMANTEKMFSMFSKAATQLGVSATGAPLAMDEVLEKMPKFDRPPVTSTYSPYDLNETSADDDGADSTLLLVTVIVLSMIAFASVIIVVILCVHTYKTKGGGLNRSISTQSTVRPISYNYATSTPTPPTTSSETTQITRHRRSPNSRVV